MTQFEIVTGAVLAAALGYAIGFLGAATERSQLRTQFLRVAKARSATFFDGVERLLEHPATPDSIKEMVFGLSIAVTDDRAGRMVVEIIHNSIAEAKQVDTRKQPDRKLTEALVELWDRDRELYDLFNETVGAGFSVILLANCAGDKKHRYIDIYELTGSGQPSMMHAVENVVRSVSRGRREPPHGGAHAAYI